MYRIIAASLLLTAVVFVTTSKLSAAELTAEEGLARLEAYVSNVTSLSAIFHQQLLDDEKNLIQESRGTLKIMRPGRFRWDYEDPYVQVVVSDGEKLWLYDEDLAQASVRSLAGSLADTPAMLLSGEGDIGGSYNVGRVFSQDDETWLVLTPKKQDTDFIAVSLGFIGEQLRYMELTDNLDQITRIEFLDIHANLPFDASVFAFEVPDGVDVIGGN